MSETKTCSKCGRNFPLSDDFYYNIKGYYKSPCKECRGASFGKRKTPSFIVIAGIEHKVCTKCRHVKPISLFTKNNQSSDGLTFWCVQCRSEQGKNYRANNTDKVKQKNKNWHERNREEINARQRISYKSNPEKKHQYYVKNRVKKHAYDIKYRAKTKERRRIAGKEYYKKTKELQVERARKRRSLKKSLPASFSNKQWQECLKYFRNTCAYCGEGAESLTKDHFIPLIGGGSYSKDNIVSACPSCNFSKNKFSFFDWYPKQQFYSSEREAKILKYLGYKNGKLQLALF